MIQLIFITVLLMLSPAFAQAPTPPSKETTLKALEQRLQNEEQGAKELSGKIKDIQKGLKTAQKDLISLGKEITENETELIKLEKEITSLETERTDIEKRLNDDQETLGVFALGLLRLQRTPSEIVMLRPGAPIDTARSQMILSSVLPPIYNRAENYQKDINRLQTLLQDLEARRAQAKKSSDALASKQKDLSGLLKTRQALYLKTQKDHKSRKAEIQRIANQAKNLRQLVKKLEENKARERTRNSVKRAVFSKPRNLFGGGGKSQLPTSGFVEVAYGEKDAIGAESQGITIQTRPRALVVAPMEGTVQYAGFFKNYGNLIILEHEKDYHSLIAGLDKIDTVVGQFVSAGEPIGKLGKKENGSNPALYFELRHKGQPVNPSKRISGI